MLNIKSKLLKLFCLEGLLLDSFESNEDSIHLQVRSPRTFSKCFHCNSSTNKIHKIKQRVVKHMVCDDKIVYLHLKLKYFKCKSCGKIFREIVPGISKKRTTVHFQKHVVKKIKDRSFSAVAKEHSISSSTLIRDTKNIFNNFNIEWPNQKFSLGIDEHSFAGRDLVITITDLTNNKLLTILKSDRQSTLRAFIKKIPKNIRDLITTVCIDMKSSYRSVVDKELNNSILVIDRFHVIQYFNWHLNQFRSLYTSSKFPIPKQLLEKNKEELSKKEKDKLKFFFKKHPPIEELWRMKEIIRTMYRCKNSSKAKTYYKAMMDGLEFDARPRWQVIYRTMRKWEKPILNYFKKRITNAFTEGCHTKIKLLKRISYGFRNKDNYIAKITMAFLPAAAILQLFTSPFLT